MAAKSIGTAETGCEKSFHYTSNLIQNSIAYVMQIQL